jgi:hypothetical protein
MKFLFSCFALLLTLPSCQRQSDPVAVEASSPTEPKLDPAMPESYIRLPEKDAASMAEKAGVAWRIIEVDGQPRPATKDHRPDRLNFALEKGKVIRVTRG